MKYFTNVISADGSQWREFAQNANLNGTTVFQADNEEVKIYSRTDDCPMVAMTWMAAAWYCNWLSQQEGIPEAHWCYEKSEEGLYDHGMKAKDRFWELGGYRLPTEPEWEMACRAGSKTKRYYGQSEALLSSYAWFLQNSERRSHPVATLKPNDFGLFDMLGNATEWCYEEAKVYPTDGKVLKDQPDTDRMQATIKRVLRGAAFIDLPRNLRSAYRYNNFPVVPLGFGRLRPVRTYH